MELANGCLCCSIKDTGIAAIEKLMEKKGAFDYILLETTGLADPAPVAELFWQNEEYVVGVASQITLDGVICVIDAVFGLHVCLLIFFLILTYCFHLANKKGSGSARHRGVTEVCYSPSP